MVHPEGRTYYLENFEIPIRECNTGILPVDFQNTIFHSITNSLEIEWSSKITEGGFSYPPQKEYCGLENPRSVEEEMHRDYYETIIKLHRNI